MPDQPRRPQDPQTQTDASSSRIEADSRDAARSRDGSKSVLIVDIDVSTTMALPFEQLTRTLDEMRYIKDQMAIAKVLAARIEGMWQEPPPQTSEL